MSERQARINGYELLRAEKLAQLEAFLSIEAEDQEESLWQVSSEFTRFRLAGEGIEDPDPVEQNTLYELVAQADNEEAEKFRNLVRHVMTQEINRTFDSCVQRVMDSCVQRVMDSYCPACEQEIIGGECGGEGEGTCMETNYAFDKECWRQAGGRGQVEWDGDGPPPNDELCAEIIRVHRAS